MSELELELCSSCSRMPGLLNGCNRFKACDAIPDASPKNEEKAEPSLFAGPSLLLYSEGFGSNSRAGLATIPGSALESTGTCAAAFFFLDFLVGGGSSPRRLDLSITLLLVLAGSGVVSGTGCGGAGGATADLGEVIFFRIF